MKRRRGSESRPRRPCSTQKGRVGGDALGRRDFPPGEAHALERRRFETGFPDRPTTCELDRLSRCSAKANAAMNSARTVSTRRPPDPRGRPLGLPPRIRARRRPIRSADSPRPGQLSRNPRSLGAAYSHPSRTRRRQVRLPLPPSDAASTGGASRPRVASARGAPRARRRRPDDARWAREDRRTRVDDDRAGPDGPLPDDPRTVPGRRASPRRPRRTQKRRPLPHRDRR